MYSNRHKNVSKQTDKCKVERLFLLTNVGTLALKNFPESPHISVVYLKTLPCFLFKVSHQSMSTMFFTEDTCTVLFLKKHLDPLIQSAHPLSLVQFTGVSVCFLPFD